MKASQYLILTLFALLALPSHGQRSPRVGDPVPPPVDPVPTAPNAGGPKILAGESIPAPEVSVSFGTANPPVLEEFDFPGDEMEVLALTVMRAFEEKSKQPCNIVVQASAKDLKVPPFRVRGASASLILQTVSALTPAAVNAISDGSSQVHVISLDEAKASELRRTAPEPAVANLTAASMVPAEPMLKGVMTSAPKDAVVPKPHKQVLPIFAPMLADNGSTVEEKEESAKRREEILSELKEQLHVHFEDSMPQISWHRRSQVLVVASERPEPIEFVQQWLKAQEQVSEHRRILQLQKSGLGPNHPTLSTER